MEIILHVRTDCELRSRNLCWLLECNLRPQIETEKKIYKIIRGTKTLAFPACVFNIYPVFNLRLTGTRWNLSLVPNQTCFAQ